MVALVTIRPQSSGERLIWQKFPDLLTLLNPELLLKGRFGIQLFLRPRRCQYPPSLSLCNLVVSVIDPQDNLLSEDIPDHLIVGR